MRGAWLVMLAVVPAGACVTAPPLAPVPAEPTPVQAAPPAPVEEARCTAFAREGVLRRSSLSRAIDGGLGRWLSAVEVEPGVAQGHFRGWVVRSLYPGDPCYREIDLRAGDLVLRVNGKSVEHPEQASEVFASLRTAPALVVDFVRGGQAHTLTLPIADE